MRRMKLQLFSNLLIIFIISGLISCKDEEETQPAELTISPLAIIFEAGGDSSEIQITCNTSWTISDTSGWCKISKLSAEGNDSVIISVSANEDTTDRSTFIIITAKDVTRKIRVTQRGSELVIPANLSVSGSLIEFDANGGKKEIQITCDVPWTIYNTSGWCKSTRKSYDNNTTVTITALVNLFTEDRLNAITIIANKDTVEVVVKQESADAGPDIPPDNTGMRELTSIELAKEMKIGWNVGNSLEALGGETAWGNPQITKRLIDSVKAVGFNAIRIPVAWSKFSDMKNYIIQTSWMDRVEQVVNYVLDNNMYAIINMHWDGGWIQPTYAQEEYVTNRLAIMWKQIATHFRDYDDHLLFAGTNEVMKDGDYGTPTREYYTVQNGYNQTFVDIVRSTGGRNTFRHLVVQGFNTNINYTVSFAVMPTDVVNNRLMMEVHYYDPYNFTLNENSNITQWGAIATDASKTETWANESYADGQFQKMQTFFIQQGVAVILGEYGVISRTDVSGHETYRRYYNEYITKSIVDHGLIPFYWDNGFTGDHGMGIFNRSTGGQVYPDLVKAITSAVK